MEPELELELEPELGPLVDAVAEAVVVSFPLVVSSAVVGSEALLSAPVVVGLAVVEVDGLGPDAEADPDPEAAVGSWVSDSLLEAPLDAVAVLDALPEASSAATKFVQPPSTEVSTAPTRTSGRCNTTMSVSLGRRAPPNQRDGLLWPQRAAERRFTNRWGRPPPSATSPVSAIP